MFLIFRECQTRIVLSLFFSLDMRLVFLLNCSYIKKECKLQANPFFRALPVAATEYVVNRWGFPECVLQFVFTAQKLGFSVCISSVNMTKSANFLRIWLYLPKKFLIENFIFVQYLQLYVSNNHGKKYCEAIFTTKTFLYENNCNYNSYKLQ